MQINSATEHGGIVLVPSSVMDELLSNLHTRSQLFIEPHNYEELATICECQSMLVVVVLHKGSQLSSPAETLVRGTVLY